MRRHSLLNRFMWWLGLYYGDTPASELRQIPPQQPVPYRTLRGLIGELPNPAPPGNHPRILPPTQPASPLTPRPIDVCPTCVARLTEPDWSNLLEPGMESFLPDWLLKYSDVGWDAPREMTDEATAMAHHARRCAASDDIDRSTPLGAAIAKFKELEVAS